MEKTNELTLYAASSQYAELVAELMSSDLDAQAIADTLEGEALPVQQKAIATAYAIRNLQSLAAQIKEAEANMAERRKRIEARAAGIENYLKDCLNLAGLRKIETADFCIKLITNPPAVEIDDAEEIPAHLMRIPEPKPPVPQPDKKAIKAALEAGKKCLAQ